MDLETCRDSFLEYLQFEKRFSGHTLVAYTNDLNQFNLYLHTAYEIKSVAEVNHTVVRSWIVSLMEQKIAPRSVNRKITALKTFYKFLLRQGIITENPMLKIQAPKTSKRLPVFVEKEKMDTLLDTIDFGDDFEGHRNKLIIELFYATGIRLTELVNLKQSNIDVYQCQLKVLGKRNKERIVPFNSVLKDEIKKYMKARTAIVNDTDNDFLFVSDTGKKVYYKLVYRIVNAYLALITTVGKKSPHVLRHTFATHMLNNGADLNAIKELLGHASLAATQVYTHNTVEKLKNIHKQAHPKA